MFSLFFAGSVCNCVSIIVHCVCVCGRPSKGMLIVLRIAAENLWRVHSEDHTHHTHPVQAELRILSSCFMKT